MVRWAKNTKTTFARIVDPGSGSGRFVIATARAFPNAKIIAIENNVEIGCLLRANIRAAGLERRVSVIQGDYRAIQLPKIAGKTLFIGNPPYVRHHGIDLPWKNWYCKTLQKHGLPGSALAGLHLHFLLKTLELADRGDCGCFITAAEWLDVNYGSTVRTLLLREMGGQSLHLLDKTSRVFSDALTSAVIMCFKVGSRARSFKVRHVRSSQMLGDLDGGSKISFTRAGSLNKWSQLTEVKRRKKDNYVELGELFSVHRGQVTGMNHIWIAGEHTKSLPPRVLVPTITRAREIIAAKHFLLASSHHLQRVVDLPSDFSGFSEGEQHFIHTYLLWAKSQGASVGYIAKHRSPWWCVSLRKPAPIVMTYMARRSPVFARNLCGARLLNIAHGLYPKMSYKESDLMLLVRWLNSNVSIASGRTYAGGLTKFEPGEVMRLRIPSLERLRTMEQR